MPTSGKGPESFAAGLDPPEPAGLSSALFYALSPYIGTVTSGAVVVVVWVAEKRKKTDSGTDGRFLVHSFSQSAPSGPVSSKIWRAGAAPRHFIV